MPAEVVRRFGVRAIAGSLLGVAIATWVGPDAPGAFGLIVVVVMFMTILIVEAVRILARLVRRPNK